ncbi:MAG: hypothetical protein JKY51_01550, partial [Opitutaceae bacterium]|nr:hypothetical protein [Opitutaceae bacterium]
LKQKFAKGLKDQAEIERLRASGEMVPLELITNPFTDGITWKKVGRCRKVGRAK